PAVRPGRSPCDRPTGLPQRVQKRRCSGTDGSAMTTSAGSTVGMGSICTTPAPIRLRRGVPLVAPVLPLATVRPVRRDTSTRPDTRPDTRPEPPGPRRAAPGAAGPAPPADGPAPVRGAIPQVSQ